MAVLITSTDALTSDITTGVSTFSVTRSAGEGLIIGFAWVVEWESQPTITSVIWDEGGDNQAFALVDNVEFNNSERRIAVYHLANPTSAKSSTIKVHWSKSCASSGVGAYVRHVTGHDTSSLLRGSLTTVAQLGGASASISNTIASGVTDLVIDFMAVRDGALVYLSPKSGQTSGYEQVFYNGNQSISTSAKSGSGTVTTGYDSSDQTSFGAALIQLSIKEGSGSVTNGTASGTPGTLDLIAPSATAVGTGGSSTNGSGSGTPSASSIVAPSATATGTTAGNGTITTPALKNNTGTVLASISGWTVNVYNASTGALVVQKTGLATNASGILTISDAAIASGTSYTYEPVHATYGRRLPTGTAS